MVIVTFQKDKFKISVDGVLFSEYDYADVCTNIGEINCYEQTPDAQYNRAKEDWFVSWANKDYKRKFGGGRFYIWKVEGEYIKKRKMLLGKYETNDYDITDTTYAKMLVSFPSSQVVFDFQFNKE